MSIDFILPDIGEGIVECELVEWLVAEGDKIEEDQPIADVMTDKALVQIPAMHAGVVDKLYYQQGEIAKVHAPLFSMTPVAMTPAGSKESSVTEKVDEQKLTKQSAIGQELAETLEPKIAETTQDFILPDIGEGIVECEIVEWLVAEGDTIEEDQPVADVMTDKALVQIPAISAGTVAKLYYEKGDIAKVHAPLFAITINSAVNIESASTQKAVPDAEASSNSASQVSEVTLGTSGTPDIGDTSTAREEMTARNGHKALASPAVRRVARELGINIHQVSGSGKKGRVYKEDVIRFSQQATSQETPENKATANELTLSAGKRTEPIRGIKAAMAKAMVASVATIPHFTYCEEIDLTELIALRRKLKAQYAKQDIKLTMMPFFMKAMSMALAEFPVMNSQVNDDCSEITYFDDHNIGMAVDAKVGLLVPNVKQVQNKSILDLAADITQLTDAARAGRVSPEQLSGGTITISNIGAIGGTVATPIINKPEVAIVALGKVQKLPRFNEQGEVAAREVMQISWSGDHRVIDGGTIARFTNLWKRYLEDPPQMLVNMN
ncbi:dihydrolipoyllysine-residue acetyltransferase [Thalassotalea euphylliae]|uniref:Dihydrolipoamide acetyltransferase component of pyruvate dehydrogenase complex n=1 Tax=Thalassotalea euphylliae TaxID=1655234 RepID=A0A3E0TRZ8_9GAMM|nr:dihydrolipoyllysine-residue acetyltransferase [Thalassotalea euphylliae]REL27298.1 dihydrolipoyllysine-residue acetyltransferase [Thalassotalea euphylliae]